MTPIRLFPLVVDFGATLAVVVPMMVIATIITFEVHNRYRLSIAVCRYLIACACTQKPCQQTSEVQGAMLKGGVNHQQLQFGPIEPHPTIHFPNW